MEEKREVKERNNRKGTILGYSIWRLLAYYVIYSFLGFVVETLYGMFTKGVIESRQSFLYGPFCAIYGLGAIIMIVSLQFFNKNNNRLFFGGFMIGSLLEYLVSLMAELLLHVKWWDYSNMPFNIDGRVCIFFSIFWGFLAIYLMSYINPRIDRLINFLKIKISIKKLKMVTILVNVFLLVDCFITIFALGMFFMRIVYKYNLDVANKEVIDAEYERIYQNEKMANLIDEFFNDEKMIKTFPNLKMEAKDGTIIHFSYFVSDVKPYYYRLNSNLRGDLVKVLKQEDINFENIINGKEN